MRVALLLTIALAGCAGDPSLRFAVPQPAAGDPIRIAARTVEIREVTLPTYADSEEIFVESPGGFISSDPSLLWADQPSRAMTLSLSRLMGEITGARTAPEPWPFESIPDARIEVRVDEMVAGADGLFRFSGQYFIGSPTERVAERSGVFSLTAPYQSDLGIPSIANARAVVLRDLARLIADQGF
ncbi:membrane integrity-associated transporter subunit PqiC [Aestuariibius sp. 2305UL40-4]|uniref:PqiC family protein n=1 Tax=Aestuariibius violaceus TaxID=3234132 RepID=UPI00345E0F35